MNLLDPRDETHTNSGTFTWDGTTVLFGDDVLSLHPPGTGEQHRASFPWHLTLDALHQYDVGDGDARRQQLQADGAREVIKAVLDKLAEQRPTASTIVDQSRRELADATAFVRKQDLR